MSELRPILSHVSLLLAFSGAMASCGSPSGSSMRDLATDCQTGINCNANLLPITNSVFSLTSIGPNDPNSPSWPVTVNPTFSGACDSGTSVQVQTTSAMAVNSLVSTVDCNNGDWQIPLHLTAPYQGNVAVNLTVTELQSGVPVAAATPAARNLSLIGAPQLSMFSTHSQTPSGPLVGNGPLPSNSFVLAGYCDAGFRIKVVTTNYPNAGANVIAQGATCVLDPGKTPETQSTGTWSVSLPSTASKVAFQMQLQEINPDNQATAGAGANITVCANDPNLNCQ